jgi:molecular chaperone GrpE
MAKNSEDLKDQQEETRGAEAAAGEESAPAPGAAPSEAAGELAAVCEQLRADKQELYDRLLRKQAEFDNLRKRLQREKEEFVQHATADLVKSLLPVLDGFERALKHRDENVSSQFYEGVELIHRQLLDVLTRAGVSAVPAEGEMFDPHLHQAVEAVEAPGHRDQEIVEELQRGYTLRQRLLRPAIVKVAVDAAGKTGKD